MAEMREIGFTVTGPAITGEVRAVVRADCAAEMLAQLMAAVKLVHPDADIVVDEETA